METLEQFKARQQQELAKHEARLKKLEEIGEIPGLSPYILHSGLYGWGHVQYKLTDKDAFLKWARETVSESVHAVEGRYKSFLPEIPGNKDYEGSKIVASGDVVVEWDTFGYGAANKKKVRFYLPEKRVQISFDAEVSHALTPSIKWSGSRGTGRYIESWTIRYGNKTYVRCVEPREHLTVQYLLSWGDLEDILV